MCCVFEIESNLNNNNNKKKQKQKTNLSVHFATHPPIRLIFSVDKYKAKG